MAGGRNSGFGVWLGAGAVSLGVGAAIAGGCGFANADAADTHPTGHSAASGKAGPAKTVKPTSSSGKAQTEPLRTTSHQPADIEPGGHVVGRSNRVVSTAPAAVPTAKALS